MRLYGFIAVERDNSLVTTPRLPVDLEIMPARIPFQEFELRQIQRNVVFRCKGEQIFLM